MSQLTLWGPRVARVLLGLPFVLFGLNYFVPFMPTPPPPPESAMAFLGGLMASGYIMPLVKSIEIAAGLALLSNRFVPLALTLLAPIIVNIVAFHFILAPSYGLPTVILALELFLAYSYRAAFLPMLRARVEPAVAAGGHAPQHREATATG
ncbi:MAG: DoxX family protein [Polyangiaceae bacterium]|nr:DoxX family protein [Polyangiaceae bacterium]